MRESFGRKVALTLLVVAFGTLATGSFAAGKRAGFHAWDDVQFDPTIPPDALFSAIECVGGGFTGNPVEPCTEGSRIQVRGLPFQSLVTGTDDRFQGPMTITANANLDPDYTGPVWGQWSLDVGDGAWTGIWFGRRFLRRTAGGDVWIGKVRIIGYGSGSLQGLKVVAKERIRTFTPLPFPYEALVLLGLGDLCPGGVCPPEGRIRGVILDHR